MIISGWKTHQKEITKAFSCTVNMGVVWSLRLQWNRAQTPACPVWLRKMYKASLYWEYLQFSLFPVIIVKAACSINTWLLCLSGGHECSHRAITPPYISPSSNVCLHSRACSATIYTTYCLHADHSSHSVINFWSPWTMPHSSCAVSDPWPFLPVEMKL